MDISDVKLQKKGCTITLTAADEIFLSNHCLGGIDLRILHIIGSLDPRWGGPVEVVRQQAAALINQGHEVDILTLDGIENAFLADVPGNVHALGPSLGKYALNFRLIRWFKQHATKYRFILVHGLWQFQGFGTWLASKFTKITYFIYTHGMLDSWFKNTYPVKHIKKMIYWFIAERQVLNDARGVLFSCEGERNIARKSFPGYRANEIVAPFGVQTPEDDPAESRELFYRKFSQLREKRILLFLSRIHPVKGCELLIEAFAQVKDRDAHLQLVMAGPDQIGWMAELKILSRRLNIENRITWTGMLNGNLKWGAYRTADVFVLPSHTENFGVVIAEALACGLPVLTTKKVNIWREVQQSGAGFVGTDDQEGVTSLLRNWLELSEEERARMRKYATKCFNQKFEITNASKNLIDSLIKSA